MEYAHLGRTGLKVSRVCLGTMNFGPQTSEADAFRIMDLALEHGINFFDTANVYCWKLGEGVTEQILGRWFAQGGDHRAADDRTARRRAARAEAEAGCGGASEDRRNLARPGGEAPKAYAW